MKNKIIIGILIFVFVLIGLALYTQYIDSARVRNGVEPKFTIKTVNFNGDKITYWGLGYKVVRKVGVSPDEPYENNIGVKYGSLFMNDNFFVANNEKDNEEKITMTIKEGTLTDATIIIKNNSNKELSSRRMV